MIDPENEKIYNILLSIFLGIFMAIIINEFYQKPITQIIYKKK
jgi:ABC-type phosphate transport system permease subunit